MKRNRLKAQKESEINKRTSGKGRKGTLKGKEQAT
jgi:hypothetical protein